MIGLLKIHRVGKVAMTLGAGLLGHCSPAMPTGKHTRPAEASHAETKPPVASCPTAATDSTSGRSPLDVGWGAAWLGGCNGPLLTAADARPILGAPRRGPSEGASRLAALRQTHCGLALRMLGDVRAERRILDDGNSNGTFRFPGLDQVRTRLFPPSPALNPCMCTADSTLLSVNHGEWGGGIAVVDRDGASVRHLLEGNVMTIARTSAGLVAVGGLSHMSIDYGFLAEIRLDGPGARLASLACLPAEPHALALDADGTLIVVSEGPRQLLGVRPLPNWGDTRDFIPTVLDDDGSLYDLGCDPGVPGGRIAESWSSSVDVSRCQGGLGRLGGVDGGSD